MALRDILRRHAIVVAFGVEADINSEAEFDYSVENDPTATLAVQCGNGFHGYQCARLNRYDAVT
jgi:hypothetical protein